MNALGISSRVFENSRCTSTSSPAVTEKFLLSFIHLQTCAKCWSLRTLQEIFTIFLFLKSIHCFEPGTILYQLHSCTYVFFYCYGWFLIQFIGCQNEICIFIQLDKSLSILSDHFFFIECSILSLFLSLIMISMENKHVWIGWVRQEQKH